ncbi:hypothetical protein [Microbacterium halophytorum]|uniref:hypothetical protein n=1 Tax=Microbacterium halophytorum TaxID=2067568 RepID=UPI001319CE05|nr:hypothetical protein [Microbacterium halophytorum]
MGERTPLRERIREAGGLYNWANSRLIRYAGPPSVGKLTDYTPPPCDGCRRPKAEHVEGADGSLACPSAGG